MPVWRSLLKRAQQFIGGSYQLQKAELAREQKKKSVIVTVQFLDDAQFTFEVDKNSKGAALLNQVFDHIGLKEKDYFGLQYKEQPGNLTRWLDPNKSFKKQWCNINCGDEDGPQFQFRVKFYVADPCRLVDEFTRYIFYLQIRRDILEQKVICPINKACLLASYVVQSELGDFNPRQHYEGYLSSMQLVVSQTSEIENRISELHKLHNGQLSAEAETNYLEYAKKLCLYGVELHTAVDSSGKTIELGVSASGLMVFQKKIRINLFSWSKMVKLTYKRKDFFIQLRRESSENYDTLLGFSLPTYASAKILWKSCVEHHSFFRLERPNRLPRFLPISLSSRFNYSGRTEIQAIQESKKRDNAPTVFTRSPSKRLTKSNISSPIVGGNNNNNSNNGEGSSGASDINNGKHYTSLLSLPNKYDNKVTSSASVPRKAWELSSDESDVAAPSKTTTSTGRRDAFDRKSKMYDTSQTAVPMDDEDMIDENLVTIALKADENGRFGFNVRGGLDHELPIIVTRVAPNTPADKTEPRLCEGDQVVKINGINLLGMYHNEVIKLIKSTNEYASGDLILKIKQNALIDNSEDEPVVKYVPENLDEFPSINGDDLFTQSLLLLSDGLGSGALVNLYEKLYRKNSMLFIMEAKKAENLNKNRYRDISPYDSTRVILIKAPNGDYINANYINMDIPNGPINRYIATQGPLESTTSDFWHMVQQESSRIIVMLTTVMERGRIKCHQYFPSVGDILQITEDFWISGCSEYPDETGSFITRKFTLCNRVSGESRLIHHLQYLAWPDHGVPSDPNLFIEFTEKLRSIRESTTSSEGACGLRNIDDDDDFTDIIDRSKVTYARTADLRPDIPPLSTSTHQYMSAANPPVIVHCSAGIGRSGVLILMDTAFSLMQAKQPVYPLDIVRAMRDQRPCMVQNVCQYRFVCESICTAFAKIAKN